MIRKLILSLALIMPSLYLFGQSGLTFDKRFVQSEDKWVAFPMSKDSLYNFGFIYIDAQAGLTLELGGNFKIAANGAFVRGEDIIKTSVKYRLEPNNVRVAHIPESRFVELKIEKVPTWLKGYKEGENTKERLYKWGFQYNAWGECEKALEFLEKAKTIDPNFKGLRTELAYSYNCLERYKDALSTLSEALKVDPKDAYTIKELIYTQVKLGEVEEAKKLFKNTLATNEDKTHNSENAYQILHYYFTKKDVANFNQWLTEFGELMNQHELLKPYIEKLKAEMGK